MKIVINKIETTCPNGRKRFRYYAVNAETGKEISGKWLKLSYVMNALIAAGYDRNCIAKGF